MSCRSASVVAVCFSCLVAACSTVHAQATITGPNDGDSFKNNVTISVAGYIEDAPNTVYIKLRRSSSGTIYDSGSQVVLDSDPNDGASYGYFSIDLDSDIPRPLGEYTIEAWEDKVMTDSITITIVSG